MTAKPVVKSIVWLVLLIILIGITACIGATTTIINNTTVLPTSSISITTTAGYGLVAEANSEVADVKTANEAYAADNQGKYAPDSNKLVGIYITGMLDAIYFFNEDTGIITSVSNGIGYTKNLQWDSAGQKWK